MKVQLERIKVGLGPEGQLKRLYRLGRRESYSLSRILDEWRSSTRWWEGQASREYQLVELVEGMVWEIYECNGVWTLSRIAD